LICPKAAPLCDSGLRCVGEGLGMFWRKKKNREDRMPWYRRRDYMTSAPYPARARYKPSVRTPDILCFWRLLPNSLLARISHTVA
jgi:hypothetical protein